MISLQNVTYTYEGQKAPSLEGVSLHIQKGECVLLCGQSGCGKTTATRLLNGMIPNFFDGTLKGEVTLAGENIGEQAMHQIARRVGSVFQNPRTQFYTTNTTSEIAFGCENLGYPREEIQSRVDRTARDLRIGHLLNRNIFQLSGGEKQIIALAGVYAMNPDVYILDEPSSNLDTATIGKVREILSLLKAQGKTIVIAEHRIYYLKDLADRALYFENGRLAGEYSMAALDAMDGDTRLKTGIRGVGYPAYAPHPLPPAMMNERMDMRFIECRYGKKTVLDVPKLHIFAGEIVAVVGANGAGKSTFVTALCGLLKGQKGMYFRAGKPLFGRQRVKESYMVLQEVNHQLFAGSVEEEVTLGAGRADEDTLGHILKRLNLAGLEKRHPMTLSGGQKQRVAIAAAMFCGKRVLVLDEPTSGLYGIYAGVQAEFAALPGERQRDELDTASSDGLLRMIDLIYSDFEMYKLLFFGAAGTRYEHYMQRFIDLEINATHHFIAVLARQGRVTRVDEGIIHILASAMFSGMMEIVDHDMEKEKALGYITQLRNFYSAGWRKLLGF